MCLLSSLRSRDLVQDVSHPSELEAALGHTPLTFYCGFDPTADSLHVGHLLPLIYMRRLFKAGHNAIALVGSATGMIGDPSGKSAERNLLSPDALTHNVECIQKQIALVLGTATNPDTKSQETNNRNFILVKNSDWLGKLNLIDFLRDIGKMFSVNSMLAKDSVRSRIENREQGISYTEFSYMLLQAYDFYWLNKEYGCRLQIGGSDQWGNITAGIDLIRRMNGSSHPQVFGLTFPLITTSSGTKFGKTEQGAVWLDAQRTSPYRFYQFWINTPDADALRYLRLFSELSLEEISALGEEMKTAPEKRTPQRHLAEYLTNIIHGPSEVLKAQRASQVLFGGDITGISSAVLRDIFADVPSASIERSSLVSGTSIVDLAVTGQLTTSRSQARKLIENGGLYLNNKKVDDANLTISETNFIDSELLVLRSGKKNYCLITLK